MKHSSTQTTRSLGDIFYTQTRAASSGGEALEELRQMYSPPQSMLESGLPLSDGGRTGFLNSVNLSKMVKMSENVSELFDDQYVSNIVHDDLSSAYQNPYTESIHIAKAKIEEEASSQGTNKAEVVSFLQGLKSLYLNPSQVKEVNDVRRQKFNLLLKYFSNTSDSWSLDDRSMVIFNGVPTHVRLGTYIDYFIKNYSERGGAQKPLYFDELFTSRISGKQAFSPIVKNAENINRQQQTVPHSSTSKSLSKATIGTNTEPRSITDRRSVGQMVRPFVRHVDTQTVITDTPKSSQPMFQEGESSADAIESNSTYELQISQLNKLLHSLQNQLSEQKTLNMYIHQLEQLSKEQQQILTRLNQTKIETSVETPKSEASV